MRMSLGCRQQRGSIAVGTWVNLRRGVGRYLDCLEMWTQTSSGFEQCWGASDSVGRSASGRGSIGVGVLVGTSVGRRCGRKRRLDAGNRVGRSSSGRGSIGIGALVGLTVFSERCPERRWDLCWLEPRTQTASGCQRPHETIFVRTRVDWCWGVGRAGESVGRSAPGRRSGCGVLVEYGVKPLVGCCWL